MGSAEEFDDSHAASRRPLLRRFAPSRRRPRRGRRVIGAAVAVAAVLGAGAFIHETGGHPRNTAHETHRGAPSASANQLLTAPALAAIAPRGPWQLVSTTDNTQGSGINTLCQRSRFADDRGIGTLVRRFRDGGKVARDLVQTVEVSDTPGDGRKAYATTTQWYAGCTHPRLQLDSAYRVAGVGDAAQAFRFRIWAPHPRSYVVGVARTGGLTISTVLDTTKSGDLAKLVDVLGTAVTRMCHTNRGGSCQDAPQIAQIPPPPSGEANGMLATADLPGVANLRRPWVGTRPAAATVNPAATTCDHADFRSAGASTALTRTFLIPQAKLPRRFGLSETYGVFASRAAARKFFSQVQRRMATCAKHDLGATVSHPFQRVTAASAYAGWRLDTQINKAEEKVSYWMSVVRVGRYVAQVNFAPAGADDLDQAGFTGVVTRARDRLLELTAPSVSATR